MNRAVQLNGALTISGGAPLPENVAKLCWPIEQLPAAFEALVHAARLEPGRGPPSRAAEAAQRAPPSAINPEELDEWIAELASQHGVEAVSVRENHAGATHLLCRGPPLLIALPAGASAPTGVLAVHSATSRAAYVIAPSGRRARIACPRLVAVIVGGIEARAMPAVAELLTRAGVPARRRARAARALFKAGLVHEQVEGVWLLRSADHGALPLHAPARALRRIGQLALLHLLQYAVLGFAWRSVAAGSLLGFVDRGELSAWLLGLLSCIPLQAAISWQTARLGLEAGVWLRRRMLAGLLAQGPQAFLGEGVGKLLGRVFEAGAVESLGFGGVLLGGLSLLDLAVAALLMWAGAAGPQLAACFAGVVLLLFVGAYAALRRRSAWTEARLALTHDLVENMAGHRTRRAQDSTREPHAVEDRLLDDYLQRCRPLDRWSAALAALPRLWLVAAIAQLSIGLVAPGRADPLPLALSVGGALLGARALATLAAALAQLSAAWIAWRDVAAFVLPRRDPNAVSAPPLGRRAQQGPSTLEARALTLRAGQRDAPLLEQMSLQIDSGDRLLLQGPSGCGKSTLVRVLAGMGRAEQGLLLCNGLDQPTLGLRAWRQLVTLAPQFHENHVFGATLAFNLLMGRRWPAEPADLREAENVARELGLGPLIERMPSGLAQIVGETGWQLSHGERSRLFAARAILSRAALIILDESLAALDPITAEVVLDCAERHTRALLLVAHP